MPTFLMGSLSVLLGPFLFLPLPCLMVIIIMFFETDSYCMVQAGLKLQILLPQPPQAGITGVCHHALFLLSFPLISLSTSHLSTSCICHGSLL
jgi:hypothetical protein